MCSCDQILVTLAFLWEKLSQPQFYKVLTRKMLFFEGWSSLKFNNLGLALVTNLKFYTSVAKGWKLKVKKFWGLICTFLEVTGEKLVEGHLWVRVRIGLKKLPKVSQNYLSGRVLKNIYLGNFMQILSKHLQRTLFTVKFHALIIFFCTPWEGCGPSMKIIL